MAMASALHIVFLITIYSNFSLIVRKLFLGVRFASLSKASAVSVSVVEDILLNTM